MRTLAAIALLFSVQAFACPTLTGNYTCKNQDGSTSAMTITQNVNGTVTTYNLNGSDLLADNQARPMQDDDNIKSGTFRAWCDDNITLKGEILGKYWNNGSYFGDLTLDIGFSLAANGDLQQVSTGNIKNTGGTYPINQTTACTKN